MFEWSQRDAFYAWCSLLSSQSSIDNNNNTSRVALRLRSSRFAQDEEYHAFERHVRLNFMPRSSATAPSWWSRQWTSRTPHTPAILLRRFFSIRGVFQSFHDNELLSLSSLQSSINLHHLYTPENWPLARVIHPVDNNDMTDDDLDYLLSQQPSWVEMQSEVLSAKNKPRATPLSQFERVIGTFEAARAFLREDASFQHVLATHQFRMPIPARFQGKSIVDMVREKCTIAATLFWRVYHLHRVLHWAKRNRDPHLEYWTQLYIDSHLPLWASMERFGRWTDREVNEDRIATDAPLPKVPQHPLSPENFADRSRYIHGTAHHVPRRNESSDFPKPPEPHRPHRESHPVTLYELFYPSSLNVHCWQEGPCLSHTLLVGPHVLATGPERGESNQYYEFARVLLQKSLPERRKVNHDKSSHTQLQKLYHDHPGCARVIHECLFIAMMGNLPSDGRRIRPSFATRLRLHSTFRYELKHSVQDLLNFMKVHRFSTAALLREYVECAMIPGSRLAYNTHHFDYRRWASVCLAGGNTWRQQIESVTHYQPHNPIASVRAIYLDMTKLETVMAQFTTAANACCYHRSSGPVIANSFVSKMVNMMTVKIYQRIRRRLNTLVTSTEGSPVTAATTAATSSKKRKRKDADDEEAEENEESDDEGNGVADVNEETAIVAAEELANEDVDANDIASIQKILVRAGRRMKEVVAIADITNLLRFTMANVPKGHSDQLLRAIAWRVSRQCTPHLLPTYFLADLFGVSQAAIHTFRHWMFFYNNYDLSDNQYEMQIRTMWLHDPKSFTVLWRYMFYYDMYRSERRVPLTREIAQAQWLAKQRALGLCLTKKNNGEEEEVCEATRLKFYFCSVCRAWVHLTTPTSNIHYFHDDNHSSSSSPEFVDPIDIIRDRAFSSIAWDEGKVKQRIPGEVTVRSLGIFGTSPTAFVPNGTGRHIAVHALNTRGTGATTAGTTGRAEAAKPHASNTITAYYDPVQPITARYRCARPKSKNPKLLIQRAAMTAVISQKNKASALLQYPSVEKEEEVVEEFHQQYAIAVKGDDKEYRDHAKAQRLRTLAPQIKTATHGAARARRCGDLLLEYNLNGYGRIVDNNRLYVACGACASLTIADPKRYVPEFGWVCARHGITARGFDPLTGNLIPSPDVTSQTTNTLDRIAAAGRVRLTPILALGRLTQASKIPLPWLVTLGAVSFLDWVTQRIFPHEHARDFRDRIQSDIRAAAANNPTSTAQYVVAAHDSAFGSRVIDLAHQVPFGLPIKPHPHLRCEQCPAEVSHAHTLLLGGGRIRLCMKHSAQYLLEYCIDCKVEIAPWERCKAVRVKRQLVQPDSMEGSADDIITTYLCVACYCKHKRAQV